MSRTCALILAALVAASPVAAQTVVRPGQTIDGELSSTDPKLDDDSHYDCFTLQTRQGQTLQIDQVSDAFDSYLQVGTGACDSLSLLQSDDDGGDGTNARLTVEGDGASRTIRANSLLAGQIGRYSIRVTEVGSSAGPATSDFRAPQGPYTLLTRQDSSLVFMDQGSVRRVGNIAYVTSYMAVDAASLARGEELSHLAMANEFNCAAEAFRIISGRGYRASGLFVGETAGDRIWGPIAPNSPAEDMFNVGCRGHDPTGKVLGSSPEAIADDFRRASTAR
jgi:hypothetical protein